MSGGYSFRDTKQFLIEALERAETKEEVYVAIECFFPIEGRQDDIIPD